MEGVQPAKLSDEARSSFASAVASQPEEGAETVAVESAPVPDGGTSPATVPAAETAVVAEPAEGSDPAQPVLGDEHVADDPAKGPIPYDRFKEVNEAKKRLEAEVQALKTRGADPAILDQMANDRARAQLSRIAAQHPELQSVIFGEPNPPSVKPSKLPALDMNDPVQARVAAIEASQRAVQATLQSNQRETIVRDMETRAEARMETHPVFKSAEARTIGETLIAQGFVRDPRMPVETVVDDVAKLLRTFQESTKTAYVKPKVEAPKKVPVGVGGGNAAPPGAPAGQKFAFGGSARKGLEAALRAEQQA